MLTRRAALGLLAALPLVSVASPARASIARAISLRDLVRSSQRSVVGTALGGTSRWEDVAGRRRIITETRVRIDETLDGHGDAGDQLLVRTLGGRVGKIGQIVHGEAVLRRDERAVLFLADAGGVLGVTAMCQGHYPVRSAKLHSSPRMTELQHVGPDSAIRRLVGRELPEARTTIVEAWGRR